MIVRSHKVSDFSSIANAGANDSRLSADARASLWHLLCKPDGWEVNTKYLMAEFSLGRDSIRRALRELQDAYYLRRARYHANGRWHWLSEVYEVPRIPPSDPAAEPPPDLFDDADVIEWADERFEFSQLKTQTRKRPAALKGRFDSPYVSHRSR